MWFSVEVSAAKLSIQVIVFVVLGALGGDLERHALVRHLIHPDTGRDRSRSGQRSTLFTGCGSGRGLSAEFPAGVDKVVERRIVVEDEDHAKFLHPETEASLELHHLHERLLPALVVHGDALALAGSKHEDL